MKGLARSAALTVALLSPAAAQERTAPAAPTIQERIDRGMDDAAAIPPSVLPERSISAESVTIAPDELRGTADASLVEPASAARLRTPIDSAEIEQRIDKGLTAAGETSAFPPDYAYGAFQRGYFLTAFSLALERAETGDAAAQTLLGELLSRGLGVKQDLAAAADWYSLASDRGDPEATYALARFYLDGTAGEADLAKAANLLERAAKGGIGVAARELGYLLLQGKGRAKNAMLAAAYLRRAAGEGDMEAQYTLAGLYIEGVGVVADEAQAARWFAEAARNGHVGAQIEYGILLFNGRGAAKDEAGAARWFREAANADNPLAQMRLARLFAEGRGVEKDAAEAARWYLIANERGVRDDFLDDWMTRLDQKTREAAVATAARWTRVRQGSIRGAALAAKNAAPVDNQPN